MTGVGNPSATGHYVRKRPTKSFQADASGYLGSWDMKRIEADVSGPLNDSGSVSARVVFACMRTVIAISDYNLSRTATPIA